MMRKSDHSKELLIVGLLFLALIGKGALATPPAPKQTMDPTKPPASDPSQNGKSNSPGENDQPTDGGVQTRSNAGNDAQNMPGGGSGVPDKSKMQTPPPNMPPMTTPPFMMPTNVADLIDPTAPKGGTALPGGAVFIPGLPGIDPSTGMVIVPGSGPYTPSITTVYGNTTYTNFNPALFSSQPPKQPGMTAPEMVKQPTPPMMIPPTIPPVGTMFGGTPFGTPIPVEMLPQTMFTLPFISASDVRSQPPPMMMPPVTLPPGKTSVPNPLMQTPDLLSMILKDTGGFGQSALNAILQGGKELTGAFSMLQGFAIPGGFGFGAKPIMVDAVG